VLDRGAVSGECVLERPDVVLARLPDDIAVVESFGVQFLNSDPSAGMGVIV